MDEEIGQNLRFYSRQLTAQLENKNEELADLQRRFSKLQGRFAQLDYAFKKNLELHQRQMIAIYDLRLSEKELRKVDKDRWKQFCKLRDQLVQIKNEKDAAKSDLAYCKRAIIDQKKFYEGKFEECLRECKLRMEADLNVHQRTLAETQNMAEKHIQELVNRLKLNEEESEAIRKKKIILQGDFDVLRHRTQELACLIENSPGIDEYLQTIGSSIVKVLRSFGDTNHDEYDEKMKKLHEDLLRLIPRPAAKPEGDDESDYKTLRSQNLVLREVVKKLKNELTKVQKSEVIVPKEVVEETQRVQNLRRELIEISSENKKLRNLLAEKDARLKQFEIESKKNTGEFETSLELLKSTKNQRQKNFPKTNNGSSDCDMVGEGVEADDKFAGSFDSRESRDFNDDKSQEAYWGLQGGRVKKFKEQATRDTTKNLELNLEPPNSGRSSGKNCITLKDEHRADYNTGSYLNAEKMAYFDSKFSRSRLQPVESHLNSVQYKEYTISLSEYHNLKIRHPTSPGSVTNTFRFRSVYSEKEYQNIPVDEVVLYFESKNGEPVLLESKMANCAVQTIPIRTSNVFTQTTPSTRTFDSCTSTGVKILNTEKQAIERSLRDLEKTVCEAGKETLGLARSMIVNAGKFPPSEEFFDCIRYLSQCGAT